MQDASLGMTTCDIAFFVMRGFRVHMNYVCTFLLHADGGIGRLCRY